MKNSLLWTEPSITCLGDRLLDTMLLATFAKIIKADLFFPWKECPFTIGEKSPKYAYKTGERKSWDRVRFEDYKFENLILYFNLPSNIKINQTCSPTHCFTDIIGGGFSPALFHDTFIKNLCSFSDFEKLFTETMKEFTPTKKLENLVNGIEKPNVSIHLRRTDKINIAGDYTTWMTYEGLDQLNEMTKKAIDKLYNEKDRFYFASDDDKVRNEYEKIYPNHIKHNVACTDIEKTYIDLFMLSISDSIILSQVHSNFSIFASYINNARLIFLYDGCLIINNRFNLSKNFVHYRNI